MPSPRCVGVANEVFPGNRTCLYRNAVVFGGRVYVHETPQTAYVHNRWTHTYTPFRYSALPPGTAVVDSPLTAVLHFGMHSNIGHTLLDTYYSAWHSFAVLSGAESALSADIQLITFLNGTWPSEIVNRISGVPYKILSHMNAATRFPNLIIGTGGKGMCIVDHRGVVLGDALGTDPVDLFARRIYRRFNVSRYDPAGIDRIVHAQSKRPLEVVLDQPHMKTRWERWTFPQQLRLLARTKVLVVGVGTVRTNTFLLPPGSIEVQTFTAQRGKRDNMVRRDDHMATLVDHVRIVCATAYTPSEARAKRANLTHLVATALASDPRKRHWRADNAKCYKRAANPIRRSGWPPRPRACDRTCPRGHPFDAGASNMND